ncbi:MAG: hypothetical protein HONDAALG_01697 [Gammaproteobacteria bacterium]|nr:hypothetical protein [Gammaproteobacteria bacterium]
MCHKFVNRCSPLRRCSEEYYLYIENIGIILICRRKHNRANKPCVTYFSCCILIDKVSITTLLVAVMLPR